VLVIGLNTRLANTDFSISDVTRWNPADFCEEHKLETQRHANQLTFY